MTASRVANRRLVAGLALLAVALLTAAPREGSAKPRFLVHAELFAGGNSLSLVASPTPPYHGSAILNGKRLKIECLKSGHALYTTYNPLFPVVYANAFWMRGRLPDGRTRWIIGASFSGITSFIVRGYPGSGRCGTDALASGNLAVGYVIAV